MPAKGRAGSDVRTKINDTRVHAFKLLITDTIGPELDECFDLARQAGTTLKQIEGVRRQLDAEPTATLGGMLVKNASVRFCLATMGAIIATVEFVSRQDVAALKSAMVEPFGEAEEIAADDMDSMSYQALIRLHAAITNHLVESARPLPRMLRYEFADILPSLVLAYKLYDDAARCDEVRQENKIVHPAFCPIEGRALSQ
ncbi:MULTISPECIES: hypothetical protein [Bradyrhizobium]|uniref:hypothetical protein n=1 Tax=Bradyrhizobium japonicum TaxID=375 RepID=UPI00209CA4CC|nr:hypothetical protein [Bradyrhizobium japonicum]MCP1778832.1 hypothetical protein [Bradyrhizobium japonicum]MCP1958170.1 hypothetical protein [Bradyrhizobium japonicum]